MLFVLKKGGALIFEKRQGRNMKPAFISVSQKLILSPFVPFYRQQNSLSEQKTQNEEKMA